MSNLQQPVDSHEETDVLSWQPHRSQDQQHSHQAGTRDTGSAHTGQRSCQTVDIHKQSQVITATPFNHSPMLQLKVTT